MVINADFDEILDEPSSGLDPRTRMEFAATLRELREQGKTLIVSSHILSELSELCTDIGIIEQGHMVLHGSMEQIFERVNSSNPLLVSVYREKETALSVLKSHPQVQTIAVKGVHNYKNKMKAIKFLRIEYSLYDVDEFGCDIPQEVNMLGYCSFGRMNQEMLCIPDQIKLLSPRCCYESSFQKIMVSESIRELPIAMCYKCIQLQSIVIPSSIGCIKEFCFQKCTSLKSIQLPTTISYIGNNCFDGCSSLSSIQLPDSISVLNERIFSNCISLKHIHFPSLLTKIRHKCFFNCKSLSSIKYYPQDKNIHFSIPYHISLLLNKQGFICHHLKYTSYDRILCNNIIPDDIHSIEKYCFACLPSLKELTLPTTLTKIGKGCFYYSFNIENISFPSSLKELKHEIFSNDYHSFL